MTSVKTGTELARGALLNVVALVTLNIRSVFTLLIAWTLGKPALGTFALAFAVVNWLSVLGTFGLDSAVMTHVARSEAAGDRARSRRLLGVASAWGLAISGVTALLGITLLAFGTTLGQPPAVVISVSVLLLSLPGIALYRVANGVSRGLGVMAHDIVSRGLTETLGTLAILLVATALGLRTMAPVVATVLGSAAGGLVAFHLARRLVRGAPYPPRRERVSPELLRFSAPIAGYGLLNTLIMRMDVLLLGGFLGRGDVTIEELAVFVAAVEVAGGMRKVRQAFDPILAPVAARQTVGGGDTDARETFARLARWVLAAQVPLVGTLCLSGGLVLSVFGRSYTQGAVWLGILAAAHGASSFAGLAETIIMVRRPGLNLVNSGFTALLQAAATVLLISWLGVTGAALGTLIAYLTQGVLRGVELRSLFGWRWPWKALWRPAAAGAGALVPSLLLRMLASGWVSELAAGLLFLAAYAVIWRLIGFEQSDREILAELRASYRHRSTAAA